MSKALTAVGISIDHRAGRVLVRLHDAKGKVIARAAMQPGAALVAGEQLSTAIHQALSGSPSGEFH